MRIIDAHTHVFDPVRCFSALLENADRFGYDKFCILSVPAYAGPVQNLACLYAKSQYPGRVYTFGGLEHTSGRSYAEQAASMARMGFDGFKMIEGKPTIRREIPIPLDSAVYDDFYRFAEDNCMPLILHAADPASFWDARRIPPWARQAGMLYGDGYEPYETFQVEVDRVSVRHPRLRMILAHFFFLSDDRLRAEQFLEDHPHVSFDVTSGFEMYENFAADPDGWRSFFIRYADRIIYGTDSTDTASGEDLKNQRVINAAQLHCLMGEGPYQAWDKTIFALCLPKAVQQKIFYENFETQAGTRPVALVKEHIIEECERLIGHAMNGMNNEDILKLMRSFLNNTQAVG